MEDKTRLWHFGEKADILLWLALKEYKGLMMTL